MSAPDEDTEKSHEPTPKKLQDARKKGDIPRSTDLSVAASYGGLVLAALIVGPVTMRDTGTAFMVLLDRSASFAPQFFDGPASAPMGSILFSVAQSLAPWFLIPAVTVILTILAQRSFVVTPSKLKPKASRISPISNAKNKYGRSGLFEFAKSFAKLLIYSLCLAFFLKARLPEMAGSVQTGPGAVVLLLARMVTEFLFLALAIALMIGGLDFLWQRQEHLRKNRMSRKELTDESKEAEGDPHLKQERRRRAQEIAGAQMLQDVAEADVVIVNPTHYAVALKWSRKRGEAPVCVAKGVDEMARRIKEIAAESAVPIRSDPPAARALYASVDVGSEIPPDQYRAVAAAIKFAEAMRKRAWRAR